MENNENGNFKTIMIGLAVVIIGLILMILTYDKNTGAILFLSGLGIVLNFDFIYKIIILILLLSINSKLKKILKK